MTINPTPSAPALHLLAQLKRESRRLIALAIPLIIAQLAQSGMGFVDTLMAGRAGTVDLAAVAIGSSIWMPLFLFLGGVLMVAVPVVAQHWGGKQLTAIAPAVWQVAWLGLGLGVIIMLLLHCSDLVLTYLDLEPAVHAKTAAYLQGIAWGVPAVALYQTLRSFSEGMHHTRPAMLISLIGLLINIPINYALIYGKLGLPALGGAGCGWATAIVMWSMLAGMLVYTHKGRIFQPVQLFKRWHGPVSSELISLTRLGLPIGLAIFVEVTLFTAIALFLAPLGATTVSAHQIAINFTSLVFMVPLSIGMAITIRVGHALGRGQPEAARFSAITGIAINLGMAIFSSSMILLMATDIAGLYTNNVQVQQLATTLLLLGALYQLSDAIQIGASGALRGYKDTRATLIITLIAFWAIGMTSGYTLGLTDHITIPMGAAGFWIGLITGLSTGALLLGARLYAVSHRHLITYYEQRATS